jgi:hypothetical protein
MFIDLTNRLLTILFFMGLLVTLRHIYYLIQTYLTSTDEEPVKYRVSTESLIWLCISIAYVLTSIFNGIKL